MEKAKCTECGAIISVNENKDAGICPYCNTAYVTKKAIQNYNINITNNNNFDGSTIVVQGENEKNIQQLADRAYFAGNYSEAYNLYLQLLKLNPNNWIAVCRKGISQSYQTNLLNYDLNTAIQSGIQASNLITESKLSDEEKCNEIGKIIGELDNLISTFYKWAIKVWNESQYSIDNFNYYKQRRLICLNAFLEIDNILCDYDSFPDAIELRKTILKGVIDLSKKDFADVYNKAGARLQSIDESYHHIEKSTNGCYIATCVYGSYDCPEVWILRRYRDYKLDNTWHGRLFIKIYYIISPKIVRIFGNTKWFNNFFRKNLDKMVVKLRNKGYSDTEYQDKY